MKELCEEQLAKGFHRCYENSGGLHRMGTEMVKGDPMILSLVALTRRAVAGMALRKREYPSAISYSCWV